MIISVFLICIQFNISMLPTLAHVISNRQDIKGRVRVLVPALETREGGNRWRQSMGPGI